MASPPIRRHRASVVLGVAAAVLLVATSQAQWGIMRAAELIAWTPHQVEWVMAGLALVGLVACRPLVSQFPVPEPPRPSYDRRGTIGVTGWGLVGLVLVAPMAGWAIGALFAVPYREPVRGAGQGVGEIFLDGVVVPALWEEFVWRVGVLAVLVRVTGPRMAVALQAAAFAVAHTSWSVGFGQVPHSVTSEYLLDGAVETAVSGVVFGFLVLELGTVWPAVVAHAVSNVGPMFLDTVPWLSYLAVWSSLSVGFIALGLMRRDARSRLWAWIRPSWAPAVLRRT